MLHETTKFKDSGFNLSFLNLALGKSLAKLKIKRVYWMSDKWLSKRERRRSREEEGEKEKEREGERIDTGLSESHLDQECYKLYLIYIYTFSVFF